MSSLVATQIFPSSLDRHHLPSARVRVRVLRGEPQDCGLRKEIDKPVFTIGRAKNCDIALSDKSVSYYHVEVRPNIKDIKIRDMGSSNGTTISDVHVLSAYVSYNKEIKMGNTTIEIEYISQAIPELSHGPENYGLIGRSPRMLECFAELEKAARAPFKLFVLLLGETGTGKELAASAIHQMSDRKHRKFVAVDCPNIPPTLFQSELFGHTKAAFNEATDRAGKFEEVGDGTIFLDEIGDLTEDNRAKLLRVLSDCRFSRIGSNQIIPMHARVIAATSKNLPLMVNEKRFPLDLFMRFDMTIQIPSLAERRDDIPLLIEHFLHKYSEYFERKPPVIDSLCREYLQSCDYPGNIRGVEYAIKRLLLDLKDRTILTLDDLKSLNLSQSAADPEGSMSGAFIQARNQFERDYLSDLLKQNNNNRAKTASAAGISRQYLYRLLNKHGLLDLSNPRDI